jgi:signal transduction histidine kinase
MNDSSQAGKFINELAGLSERYAASIPYLDEIATACRVVLLKCNSLGECEFLNTGAVTLLGSTAHDYLGKKLPQILPISEDSGARLSHAISLVANEGKTAELRFPIALRSVGGAIRDYLLVLIPGPEMNTDDRRVYGVGVDITNQREMLKDALEADKSKDRFLALVTHEMRNPLSTFASGLKLLERANLDPDGKINFHGHSLLEVFQMMSRQVGCLSRLVSDLLDLSRINQGSLEVVKRPIKIGDVVKLALEGVNGAVSEGRHNLKVNSPSEEIVVSGDLQRLSQVLINLIENSAKYTPPGGDIHLNISRSDAEVALVVTDNGIGIPKDEVPHIFEVFKRLPGPLERKQRGLGIGLYLVKMIVEAHGGRIDVVSDGQGKGSSFLVYLPVTE